MTDRERWTVYPLIILAIGLSLRDRFVQRAELEVPVVKCRELIVTQEAYAKDLRCTQLTSTDVVDARLLRSKGIQVIDAKEGNARLEMGQSPVGAGLIRVLDKDSRQILYVGSNENGTAGEVTVLANEMPQVSMRSREGAGVITTQNMQGQGLIDISHDDAVTGKIVTLAVENRPQVVIRSQEIAPPDNAAIDATDATEEEPAAAPNKAGSIVTFSPEGRPHVVMGTARDAGVVETLNSSGKTLVQVGHTLGQAGYVYVFGEGNLPQVVLRATDVAGVIATLNRRGQELIQLKHGEGKHGQMAILAEKLRPLALLTSDTEGKGIILLFDAQKRPTSVQSEPVSITVPQSEESSGTAPSPEESEPEGDTPPADESSPGEESPQPDEAPGETTDDSGETPGDSPQS